MKKIFSFLICFQLFFALSASTFAMYVSDTFMISDDNKLEISESKTIGEFVNTNVFGDLNSDSAEAIAVKAYTENKEKIMDEEWKNISIEEELNNIEDIDDNGINLISRGRLVYKINNDFNLKQSKKSFLDSCFSEIDFCTFTFVAQTNFIVSLNPEILLYPDVSKDHEYYEDITIATLLGYVNGYIEEENSPFRPERNISRIESLKVILAAVDLVPQKYKFELIEAFGSIEKLMTQTSYFEDVNAYVSYMWWYPRYVNFAVENGIIDNVEFFRPEDPITVEELDDMIMKTQNYLMR
ncbi:S-layer homology domain-containing protein [Patescibacteria group bacterium]